MSCHQDSDLPGSRLKNVDYQLQQARVDAVFGLLKASQGWGSGGEESG